MRVVVASDIHFPYESEAWELFLDLLPSLKPDKIMLLGDVVDFYPISHFMTDPQRRFAIQDDLDHSVKQLKRLRKAAPDSDLLVREGNHELRLQKYLFTKAAELSGLHCLQLPELLKFSELGVTKYLRNSDKFRIGRLWYLHGNEIATGYVHPARGLFQKLSVNAICGHVHKFDRHSSKALGGKERGAWTNACLCTLTPDYAYNPQWDNGFTKIDYVSDGLFDVSQIKFFNHKGSLSVIHDGNLIKKGRGRLISLPRVVPEAA